MWFSNAEAVLPSSERRWANRFRTVVGLKLWFAFGFVFLIKPECFKYCYFIETQEKRWGSILCVFLLHVLHFNFDPSLSTDSKVNLELKTTRPLTFHLLIGRHVPWTLHPGLLYLTDSVIPRDSKWNITKTVRIYGVLQLNFTIHFIAACLHSYSYVLFWGVSPVYWRKLCKVSP